MVDPEAWRTEVIPTAQLQEIAEHFEIPVQVLCEEWLAVRPHVESRIGSILQVGALCPVQFRRQALLPGLAARRKTQRGSQLARAGNCTYL